MKTGAYRFVQTLAAAGMFIAPFAMGAPAGAPPPQQAAMCGGCHGAHGQGAVRGVPRLAGQNADYMSHALAMFKDGTRASTVMQPIASTLDAAQVRQLTDYYSTQSAPLADTRPAPPELARAGRQLAAGCFSCHGSQGQGDGARHPRIAGQPSQFIIDRLHEFQARARGKAPDPGSMTAIAAGLTEEQIKDAATYLSRLEP